MMEDEMDLEQLWTGPRNEKHLHGCMENQFHSLNVMIDGEATTDDETIIDDFDIKDYIDPSMLGFISCRFGARKKRTSQEKHICQGKVGELFGSQYPCTSGGGKGRSRKNNDHWTEGEMIDLVNGVSRKGIGRWSKIKGGYFSTSIRTAVHLKDKWRNQVRACKAKSSSKKKVNVQKATEVIVQRFRHRILALEARHLGEKKK
ncbi:hypothetical protein PVAP13_9KG208600 [Panicum virgatum]|uniref:Myb-like domain-containing protein n=1 Tax=Panicum virgatum TaxID=38727 RepID=A0A8T0NIS5_PANVG|nr:hypothetical protein PVAP13_9KG208600 [Panicum virgatum]